MSVKAHVSRPPAAAELFATYHAALFRFAYRMSCRRDVAEDVVQEVFIRVLRGIERYEARGRKAAWLFTIARRLLLDRLRLAPDEREAFLLREVGGLGYGEIAAVCGITPAAVRSRIYRARVQLRDLLGNSKGYTYVRSSQ